MEHNVIYGQIIIIERFVEGKGGGNYYCRGINITLPFENIFLLNILSI